MVGVGMNEVSTADRQALLRRIRARVVVWSVFLVVLLVLFWLSIVHPVLAGTQWIPLAFLVGVGIPLRFWFVSMRCPQCGKPFYLKNGLELPRRKMWRMCRNCDFSA
jgi:hypothetical protein